MRMLMLRRRKMRMLRRKTDPKTGKHTSCEPAQPKCRRALHKSHSVWKISRKNGRTTNPLRPASFVRACAVKMHMDKVTRGILCGNLQGKCRGH